MLTMDTRAIEQIASALAHEVKNPLSLVSATIKLLAQDDPVLEHQKSYKTIEKELMKINDLIMQFLTLTQPTTPQFFDLVYLGDLLSESLEKYQNSYPDIRFDLFNFICHDRELVVLGNASHLTMLLDNVIKNAIEAIDKELGQISFFLKESQNTIKITAVDNGCGLSDVVKNQIATSFDAPFSFFTTKKMGTGLGLGICHKIATEHGGSFSIENGNKIGCVVKITLPLA